MLIHKALSSDKPTVTGSRLTGYIVNVMRSPVIERLMVRGSQVALKHVIHDLEARTLVMEFRRRAIKRWVPCGDMDRRLKSLLLLLLLLLLLMTLLSLQIWNHIGEGHFFIFRLYQLWDNKQDLVCSHGAPSNSII